MKNIKSQLKKSEEEFKEKYGNALEWVEMENPQTTISGIPLWNIRGQMLEALKQNNKNLLEAVVEEHTRLVAEEMNIANQEGEIIEE